MLKRLLMKGSPYSTAYYVIDGSHSGPTLMITAGTHGNEPAGIEAARRLLTTKPTNGRLIILPTVNVPAFRKRIRGVPDINRTFPRVARGVPRHPLAWDVFMLAMAERPAWLIDMHESTGYSAVNRSRLGQTIITGAGAEKAKTARTLVRLINRSIRSKSHRFTHRVMERPGSLRTAVSLQGINSITIETSISLPRARRIGFHVEIARLLMREIGLTSREGKARR